LWVSEPPSFPHLKRTDTMSDLRLSTNFADHPKTIKLVRLLGDDVIRQLLRLWGAAAIDCPDGKLRGMDIEDIEIMAGWDGEDGLFVRTLVDHGWLDLKRKTYYLHNWAERQPWISNARARSEAAKRKAEIRWSKRLRVEEPVIVHENAMLPLQSSNAPSPNPTPTPTPTPTPIPNPKPKRRRRGQLEYSLGFNTFWVEIWLPHEAHSIGSGPGVKAEAMKSWHRDELDSKIDTFTPAALAYLDDAHATGCKSMHLSTFINKKAYEDWQGRKPRTGQKKSFARGLAEQAMDLERNGL